MNLDLTYDVTRVLLGDLDASVKRYPDATLATAARAALMLGKASPLVLNEDRWSFSPEPTTAQYAKLCYWMAKLIFTPTPDGRQWRTRAYSERIGSQRDLLAEFNARIHELENGTGAFSGWQSFYTWLAGMDGLPVGGVLTDVNVRAPFWTATITRAGAQISGGGQAAGVTL